jgi:hypothetical protein
VFLVAGMRSPSTTDGDAFSDRRLRPLASLLYGPISRLTIGSALQLTLSRFYSCRGPPYTEQLHRHGKAGCYDKEPTLDSPYKNYSYKCLLNTTLLAVWFFDSSSGKVYAKVEADAMRH